MATQDPDRPNILLIMTDEQRWDTVGAAGNPIIQTPHLDRLAAEGVLFETAITPTSVCAPARAALMTGYAPSRIHFTSNGHYLADQQDTLPALLTQAGYWTQALGKMHFKGPGAGFHKPWEITYGFQDMVLSEETRWVRQARDMESVAFDAYDQYLLSLGLWGWDIQGSIGYNEIKPLISPLPEEYGVTAWLGNRTVDWLRERRQEPFFLFSSFVKPHPPFNPPENWAAMYDPYSLPPPVRAPHELCRKNPHYADTRRRRKWDLYSEYAERLSRAYYYADVSLIDKHVGRILDTLEEQGLRDNTYVIFTSDHGDMLGDHWMWLKTIGYDGSARVPLIVAGPGVPRGVRVTGSVVNTLDIFATILDRAGVPVAENRPSRDLLRYVTGEHPASSEYVVSEVGKIGRRCRSIRTTGWLYMHWEGGGYEELYDLQRDPGQLEDLAAVPGRAGIRRELRTTLIDWLRQWGDPGWELDERGDLTVQAYAAGKEQRWLPCPGGQTPAEFEVPPKPWSKEEDWWPWRWRAVDGDYRRLADLANKLYGG